MPSGPLKPPNWPPPLTCGSRSRNTPGMPRFVSFCSSVGMSSREVAEDQLVAAVAEVGGHEVLERVFVDVRRPLQPLRMAIVLDVHPAEARLHRQVLLEDFAGAVALGDDVAGVEDRDQGRVIHLPVQLGHQLAGLADQVGLDLQAEGQVAAVARLGDLAELIDRLRHVRPRDRSPWGDRTRSRGSAWSRRRGPARRPSSRRRSDTS